MMTREEFERTVRAMRAEGVTLSMPNLMLRTELPRHVIEDWLEEMDDAAKRPPPMAAKPSRDRDRAKDAAKGAAGGILRGVQGLKEEIVKNAATAAVREKLGLGGDDDGDERVHGAKAARNVKDLRVGAGLGLLGGPIGLFYAAPYPVAIAATLAYIAAAVGLNFIPVVGTAIFAYVLPLVHMSSAVAGAGYTWRYNRSGRRAALLPKNEK